MPAQFTRPDIATDEGGLWALMDREEVRLRRSPFALRDPALREYVQGIACRLAGNHCPNVRVHLMRTPLFNASMAPNGMMQIWTGLMLRMENEAQFAAVIGHEIGHYLERHAVDRLRDAKARSAFGQFLGLFGAVGAIGQLAVLASAFGYSRDQERSADRISIALMREAGYDPGEASKVWANLLGEIRARPGSDQELGSPMFATHPGAEERRETLAALAREAPSGQINADQWRSKVQPFRREWLQEELRRGQYEESIALFTRMISTSSAQPDYFWARAEAYRLRATGADFDAAVADYQSAVVLDAVPAEAYRGLALVQRQRGQLVEARASFQRYIAAAPEAPDAAMIRSYLEELGK